MEFIIFILGLVLIVKGGDWFVEAAGSIAESFGIPKFIVGATIVSLATTLPEMIVSVIAAMDQRTEMAIGNAIGSVSANTGLIMGISILVLPSAVSRSTYLMKSVLLGGAVLILWILSSGGSLESPESLLLVAVFVVFMMENISASKKEAAIAGEAKRESPGREILRFLLGAAAVAVGSEFLVEGGCSLAVHFGVPESVIALTMVAIGTSLPELVTTVTAVLKKESSMSLGNILGANIIDTALILPICAAISGGSLTVSGQNLTLDFPICLLLVCLYLVPVMFTGKFQRWQGIAGIAAYLGYLVYVICQGC